MKYIARKIFALAATLLAVSVLTFAAFNVIPGNSETVRKGMENTQSSVENTTKGPGDYVRWLCDALKGDFGESSQYRMPVSELILDRMIVTCHLAVIAVIMIIVMSFALGVASAKRQGGITDNLVTFVTNIFMSTPEFFMGMILTLIFGLGLKWFRIGGFVSFRKDYAAFISYLIVPALAIALPKMSMVVKFLRNSIVTQLKMDYVRTAKSKGLSNNTVLYKHVLKNSLVPVVTFMAIIIAQIFAGSIVIEQVFSIPGMGRLLVTSILARDYNVCSAIIMYIATLVTVFNMLADVLYYYLNPKHSKGGLYE